MSTSFRSILQVNGDFSSILDELVSQYSIDFNRAHREQKIDLGLVQFDLSQVLIVSPEIEVVITRSFDDSTSNSFRIRTAEFKDARRWVTQYSLHQSISTHNESSLVVEIDSPLHQYSRQPVWPKIPRLLNELISRYRPLDVSFQIGLPHLVTSEEEVEALVKYLSDSKRRATTMIAVNPDQSDLDGYLGLITQLMIESGGTTTAIVLDPKSAERFNELVPLTYRISRDFVRLFNPLLNFDESFQAHRHRKIAITDLDEKGIEAVTRGIAQISRGNALNRSYPLSIQKKERALNSHEQETLAHGRRLSLFVPKATDFTSSLKTELLFDPTYSSAEIEQSIEVFRRSSRREFLRPEDLFNLALGEGRIESLSNELVKLNEEREGLLLQILELREDLDEEALGRLELFEQKGKLEAEIRFLRESLINTRNAELAYQAMPQGQYEPLPLTFEEVIGRIENLNFVTFTGNPKDTIELDDIDTGSSAPHCWEYLQVLDDYARAKVLNSFDGNFMQFLRNTPDGFKSMSYHKYAPVESEQTSNRRSLLEIRTFNVPNEVDPSGRALMEAHLKLSRKIRIHFLDHTRVSGRVYVGFIGNHLPLVS
jgi:hypothetical protein